MQILIIDGDPKVNGFISGALDLVAAALAKKGVEIKRLRLAEAKIGDCLACFHCLKTGRCPIDDDMGGIIQMMLAADGFVVGSPVRNSSVTACYKRFYERITYVLGFPRLLDAKHTLAITSVGFAGGKSINRNALGLQGVFRTRLSSFLFYRVGIPAKITPANIQGELERAATKLVSDIEKQRPPPLLARLSALVDGFAMRKLMFEKSPATYAYVLDCWKKKGLIR